MLRPLRSLATLAIAFLSIGLMVAGGPTTPVQNAGRPAGSAMPGLDDVGTQTDEQPEVRRILADVDPTAPVQPRTPVEKWRAAGRGSLDAALGNRGIRTDRIFVKFRDDLKVRVTGDANRPVRSEAPIRTVAGTGKLVTTIDPNTELAEAVAMLKNYGGRVEQAIPFTAAKLRAIELRAEATSRRQQPDLAGLMLVTVGADVSRAAEAFNALDAVEFAEVELMPIPAQGGPICNLIDQALQKGSGEEGANVRACNEGTDPITGNPALCTPGPVFPGWNAVQGSANDVGWPTPPPTTGLGSIAAQTQTIRGSTICNRANTFAWWVPMNPPVDPNGNCDAPNNVEWTIDITDDPGMSYLDQHPVWDCTAVGCNRCSSSFPDTYVGGGSPDCQYGCAQSGCSDAVGAYLPSCVGSGSGQGWDALCATIANIVCVSVSSAPYSNIGFLAEPSPSQDNLTTYCYEWARITSEPVPPGDKYHFQSAGKNTQYDTCFVARGPSVGLTSTYDGAVVFTDLGDLADVSDRGIRPWGFLWEDPSNVPSLGFLQFEGASGFFDDVACQLDVNTLAGIGTKAIGGKVLAADPSLPDNAIFARLDPALKNYPYTQSHDCFTVGRTTPGCYVPTCCVYVCNIDPLCCSQSWDDACIGYARQAPDGYCNSGAIGANWNTASCGTPDFTFKDVDDLGAPHARNLQLYGTARPVVLTSTQYINLANPTKGGLIDLSAINCQASGPDPDCGGGVTPVALNETYGFLNSQFSGGGLDIASLENWALQLPDVTSSIARGKGVTVGLIDYSCNVDHEDLVGQVIVEPGQQIFTQPSGVIDPEHGAAVFGEILAADNGFGITGVAPETKGIFFPCVSINGRGRAAAAILAAGDALQPGDILCLPVEFGLGRPFWNSATYGTLLATVTDLGISTFISAGNGAFDVTGGSNSAYGVTVGACWPGRQVPLPINDNLAVPSPSYPGDAYCRYKDSNYSSDGSIDISGWGTAVCTLGVGSLFKVDGTPNRNYQQNFNGTSAAVGMIAGLAARVQSVTKAYLGSPVSMQSLRSALRLNRYAQCSGIVTGTNSGNPFITSQGDFIAPNPAQVNDIRGFPKSLDVLQAVVLADQFSSGVAYTITPIVGSRIAGTAYSTATFDQNYYRIQAARRGRGATGVGYGRPLPYAGAGQITDIQVKASIPAREADNLFDFTVTAFGRVNIGGAGNFNTLAMCYVWNNTSKRWTYLTLGFIDGSVPAAGNLVGSVVGRGMMPAAVLVPEGSSNAAYVRLVSYGLGIMGPYQMWWDWISLGTTPLGNP